MAREGGLVVVLRQCSCAVDFSSVGMSVTRRHIISLGRGPADAGSITLNTLLKSSTSFMFLI